MFGLSSNALQRFEYLAILLGTQFGSIISLGVGPIVMASIILQLLVGSGIMSIDTTTNEGKKFFQGLQKLLVIVFIVFESSVYVLMQGLQAAPGFTLIVIFQLILGGFAIYYMSELVSKWGFGSGIGLFIGAGVSWRLITSAFQFIDIQGSNCFVGFTDATALCPGKVLALIQAALNRLPIEMLSAGGAIAATIIIFLVVVWAQSLRVEVPLSFGRIRGYGVKWPLQFFYASVIPVILTAALVANIQLFGGMLENVAAPCLNSGVCTGLAKFASYFGFIGHFSAQGQATSGLAFWLSSTDLLDLVIRGGFLPVYLLQGITHVIFFCVFSTIFSIFWVKTSGIDAKSQAHRIASSGLQMAGFRQDERVLESVLERYVMPLTVMGGIAVGLLAAVSDLLGALVSGTALLLVIMIMFQLFQNIVQKHAEDINPSVRKFLS